MAGLWTSTRLRTCAAVRNDDGPLARFHLKDGLNLIEADNASSTNAVERFRHEGIGRFVDLKGSLVVATAGLHGVHGAVRDDNRRALGNSAEKDDDAPHLWAHEHAQILRADIARLRASPDREDVGAAAEILTLVLFHPDADDLVRERP